MSRPAATTRRAWPAPTLAEAAPCLTIAGAAAKIRAANLALVEGTTPTNSNIGAGSWRFEVLYPGIQIGNGAGGMLDPQWRTDASITGTGLGGGDYRPLPTSPLARVPAGMTITARDMLGQAIPADGSAFVGALAAAP
jgi:hypothetical protein